MVNDSHTLARFFIASQPPQARRLLVIDPVGTYNKKVWVAVPVARPTRLGVSHCPSLKVEQRRSPHVYAYYTHQHLKDRYNAGCRYTYPMDIYRCFVSERLFFCLRDNLARLRTKRHSRHLFYICIPTHPLLLIALVSV